MLDRQVILAGLSTPPDNLSGGGGTALTRNGQCPSARLKKPIKCVFPRMGKSAHHGDTAIAELPERDPRKSDALVKYYAHFDPDELWKAADPACSVISCAHG